MTSSTKLEVHNVSQCQAQEDWATATVNMLKNLVEVQWCSFWDI